MRIVVKSIGDMPGKARGGLPLDCILETDVAGPPTVVAYGEGGTFSIDGLDLLDASLRTYTAYFDSPMFAAYESEPDEPVVVQALDIEAALMWLREKYHGSFSLHVEAASVYLGEFNS